VWSNQTDFGAAIDECAKYSVAESYAYDWAALDVEL
jgi:hypothetical protein